MIVVNCALRQDDIIAIVEGKNMFKFNKNKELNFIIGLHFLII